MTRYFFAVLTLAAFLMALKWWLTFTGMPA